MANENKSSQNTKHRLMSSVSAGLVTFNHSKKELTAWLLSLEKAIKKARERGVSWFVNVVYINNGADLDLRSQNVTAIKLPTRGNIGYTKAANKLMQHAFEDMLADYYLSANPDGLFHPDFFLQLHAFAKKFPNTLVEAHQFPEEHPKPYDPATYETPWASGCCLLIPKTVFGTIGYFDERFFMYCEDVDYSWRAHANGFKIIHCPKAIYAHSVLNRGASQSADTHLRKSGLALARKYGDTEFARKCHAELKECAGNRGVRRVKDKRRGLTKTTLTSGRTFDHGFSFAEARWV